MNVRCVLPSCCTAFTMKYRMFDEKAKGDGGWRTPSPRQWLLLLLSLVLLFIVAHQLRDRPYNYDRRYDGKLAQFVYRSKEARDLPTKGKLFCWVLTTSKYHSTRALAVNETWLSRCDHGELFTNAPFHPDQHIPHSTVFAGMRDAYETLFWKSRFALHFIYANISSEFDWYIKADDDTYMLVENLRKYLSQFNPDEPHYFGYRLKPYLEHGFNGGGGGYAISRAALKLFSEQLFHNESLCPESKFEDVGIGSCFASIGIYPEDTRTIEGKQRFNTWGPDTMFSGRVADGHPENWMFDYPPVTGLDAFHPDLISVHHISPQEMLFMEALLYRVRRPPHRQRMDL